MHVYKIVNVGGSKSTRGEHFFIGKVKNSHYLPARLLFAKYACSAAGTGYFESQI